MFKIGDYILYERIGVCVVEEIGTLDFVSDSSKQYYTLFHVFNNNSSRIYTPISSDSTLRLTITKDESLCLLNDYALVKPTIFHALKMNDLIAHYQHLLSAQDIHSSLSLMKEIQLKDEDFRKKNKKLGSTDNQYLKIVERLVFEEFSIALNITLEEVRKRFENLNNCVAQ